MSESVFEACRAWGLGLLVWAVAAGSATADDGMRVIHFEDWDRVLEAQRPHVVVADLWASWCVSCIERFPEMADMARRHHGSGVRFVTLNLDDPQDDAGITWAEEFLAGLEAPFAHFRMDENLTESFRRLDLLAIPVVLIYDGEGVERYRFSNDDPNDQFEDDDIEQAVLALLAESDSGRSRDAAAMADER